MASEVLPPAEPPNGSMLLGLDPTPGYEGVFLGVWHRRDSGVWTDGEHRWFSSYCRPMPDRPYTWAEAVARGAQPDRPLIEAATNAANRPDPLDAYVRSVVTRLDGMTDGDVSGVREILRPALGASAERIRALNTFWTIVRKRAVELDIDTSEAIDERLLGAMNRALYVVAQTSTTRPRPADAGAKETDRE